jgi:hypothetical protein
MTMEPDKNVSDRGIEELKKKLYERGGDDFQVRRSNLAPYYKTVNKTWAEETIPNLEPVKPTSSIWWKILIFSFLFFVLALGSAWYVFTKGTNVVSDKNIAVAIKGPISLKAGEELDLQIALTNKNVTAIEEAELTSVWPAGSRDPDNPAKQFTYTTQTIGKIKAGETVNVITRAVVYGKENDELEVKLNLNYHLADSNTLFEKQVSYRLKINASPVNLSVDIPSEINSNQELSLNLKISANSDKPLNNVLLEVIYPPGFQFKSSSVPPTYDSHKWLLGDLQPGVERIINIKGVIEGQSEELKAFQVRTGIKDVNQEQTIAVLYSDFFKTLTIKKSFFGIAFLEKNLSSEHIPFTLKSTGLGGYTIEWMNNLPVKIVDAQIVAHLTGAALNKRSVNSEGGYYSSIDNTVTWDKHTKAELGSVEPGATGQLNLNFSSVSLVGEGKDLRNPQINVNVTGTGFRVSEGFSNEKVQTDLARIIKIDSAVSFSAKTFYRDGPLVNTGHLPPKVDNPTTYTLTWSLQNSSNDVKNGVMEATLPLGVEWAGMTAPNTETVNYGIQSRKVAWDLGFIKAGTGTVLPARTVSFQVTFTPSIDQVKGVAKLTNPVSFRGIDTFSESSLLLQQDSMTTLLSDVGASQRDSMITD